MVISVDIDQLAPDLALELQTFSWNVSVLSELFNLTLCLLGNCIIMLILLFADFFKINFFKNYFTSQAVGIQIRLNILSGLIRVQTVWQGL